MQRYSKQRETVLTVLRNTKHHPTAANVYEEARKVIPNISLGTVYRNLSQLSDAGEVYSVKAPDGSEHFDANFKENPHPHLICRECGSVVDLEIPFIDDFLGKTSHHTGCDFEDRNAIFFGVCNNCKNI